MPAGPAGIGGRHDGEGQEARTVLGVLVVDVQSGGAMLQLSAQNGKGRQLALTASRWDGD